MFLSFAKHPALSRVMVSQTLFPAPADEPDEMLSRFLEQVALLFEEAQRRGEIQLGSDVAPQSAQVFLCLYLSTLIGGLGGAFGDARSAPRRAELWASQLAPLVRLQVKGLRPPSAKRGKPHG